jgi:hypothetical protein
MGWFPWLLLVKLPEGERLNELNVEICLKHLKLQQCRLGLFLFALHNFTIDLSLVPSTGLSPIGITRRMAFVASIRFLTLRTTRQLRQLTRKIPAVQAKFNMESKTSVRKRIL